MEKSGERSFEDELGGKGDFMKDKKRSAVASSKLGAAGYTNRDKQVGLGHRLDKSLQQSNMTQVSKLHQEPVIQRKFQKTAGASPGTKTSSVYNLRSKNLMAVGVGQCVKSSSTFNSRSKNPIAEGVGPGVKCSSVYNSRSKNPKAEGVGPGVKSSLVYNSSKNLKTEGVGPGAKSSSVYNSRSKNLKAEGVGLGAKSSSVYKLRSKDLVTEGAPRYNMRSKVQRTEDPKASINSQNRKTLKKDSSKDISVAMLKKNNLKNSTKPIKKIETPKPLIASTADLDRKNHPLTSQHKLFLREPIYHIRWEGEDVAKGPLGYSCMLCHKDLSCATDDDDSEYNDDIQYDVDDEYYDEHDLNPPLLPAVDILSCGHAYHTHCFQKGTPKEQSSDPQCILCYNTS